MLCDICHTREAKIFYTEIINGQKREQHLCEACAGEQAISITDKLGNEIPIGSILSGILQNYAKGIAAKSANEPVCMRCGMTASELVKGGRLGCPECYNAFSMILDKNLNTVQGATTHHGKEPLNAKKTEIKPQPAIKTPADVMREATDEIARKNRRTVPKKSKTSGEEPSAPATPQIDALRAQLAAAVAEEDYDRAAALRDEIRALETEIRAHEDENKIVIKKPGRKKKEES